ncbi:two-component sensor histidine kinase [Cnuibacter physcomitrellae]|uniref:Two-component sensor histidine kinase n=1 Tax=Cnuibacter physcomitrellae TaxID=1619308 RepID=A0A1X9LKN9_9MICO|nr:sensor histidine kinase [Cnuibacter physcomitrellae]ARJ05775.1 two-component sensor histidine kinase [Cnuibacter physcomitrellae]GGI36466.1 two-component sensor histidine kinase [Cnuibacter physcomitrellae]
MAHSTLTPVFVGLRIGLHALVVTLLTLVLVRILIASDDLMAVELGLVAVFAVVYVLGARIQRMTAARRRPAGALWVTALTIVWAALMVLVPEAAYLVFPLFFLYLHVLPRVAGPVAVVLSTGIAVLALGLHGGFTLGGVVGPLVGAAVAMLIGLGYRALAREAAEREALVAELVSTRDRLAATEREQGMLAERARLAREIHDTVAQGLSSIQMLLHAAEAADGDRPGIEHIRLARATAAEGVADTRRFIRELAPPTLDDGLGPALVRLGDRWSRVDLPVEVEAPASDAGLSMDAQIALLRIAQGAVANAVQHADADRIRVRLEVDGARATLTVADDGVGFDPTRVAPARGSDSFGLQAMAERVEQLDGTLRIDSRTGDGTTITVMLEKAAP